MNDIKVIPRANATKLNVCAYARISRKTDRVEYSFSYQQQYWQEKLSKDPNINFVGVFGDEGISGKKTGSRKQFLKMLHLANNGAIDIIYTKSISRFGRNIEDCIDAVNNLKDKGVRIVFENDNIDTAQIGKDFALKCKIITADREASMMSDTMRLKMKRDRESGKVANYADVYGYDIDKDTKVWTINNNQTKVVQHIYDLYEQGYGYTKIAKQLYNQDIASPNGKEIWRDEVIKSILTNPRFIGHEVLQKCYYENGKRYYNNGEKEKTIVENHHEAIITQEQFDRVQKIMNQRKLSINTVNRYELSGKITCGHCGAHYRRLTNNRIVNFDKILWGCSKSNKMGKDVCVGGRITDTLIKEIILQCYNEYIVTPLTKEEQKLYDTKNLLSKLVEYQQLYNKGYITFTQLESEATQIRTTLDQCDKQSIMLMENIGYEKNGRLSKSYNKTIVENHIYKITIQDGLVTIVFNNSQTVTRRYAYEHRKYILK